MMRLMLCNYVFTAEIAVRKTNAASFSFAPWKKSNALLQRQYVMKFCSNSVLLNAFLNFMQTKKRSGEQSNTAQRSSHRTQTHYTFRRSPSPTFARIKIKIQASSLLQGIG